MIEKLNERKKEITLIIILSVISICIRYYFSRYPKFIFIYPDEHRYVSIARSIFRFKKIQIYNLPFNYQKILYSLCLVPLQMVSDKVLQIRLIALTNCLLMTSGVIPLYLLSKKLLKTKLHRITSVLLYLSFSDFSYTCTFMSENLFIPMGLWAVYFAGYFLNVIWDILNQRQNYWKMDCFKAALFGMYLWLLYLCKEVALCFLISFTIVASFYILKSARQSQKKETIRRSFLVVFFVVFGFAFVFFISKISIFRGMGNSYNQQDLSVFNNSFNFFYIYYAFIYYCLLEVLAFTIFPFVITISNKNNISRYAINIFLLCCLSLVISAAVVSYTISVRENWGDTLPRAHLRYVSYLFIPLVVIMMHSFEHFEPEKKKKWIYLTIGLCIWFIYYLFVDEHLIVTPGDSVDQTMLRIFSQYPNFQAPLLICYCLITIGVVSFLFFENKHKIGEIMTVIILLLINIYNGVSTTKMWRLTNRYRVNLLDESKYLSDFVTDNPKSNFLVLGRGKTSGNIIDTFMDEPNVYQIRADDLRAYLSEKGNIHDSWDNAIKSLRVPRYQFNYDSLHNVDYIIFYEYLDIDINDEDAKDITDNAPLNDPKIYKVMNNMNIPEMQINSISVETLNQLDEVIDNLN